MLPLGVGSYGSALANVALAVKEIRIEPFGEGLQPDTRLEAVCFGPSF